jgi:hypothetical protein
MTGMDARTLLGPPPVDPTTIPSVDGRTQHPSRVTGPGVHRRSRLRAPAGRTGLTTHEFPAP